MFIDSSGTHIFRRQIQFCVQTTIVGDAMELYGHVPIHFRKVVHW